MSAQPVHEASHNPKAILESLPEPYRQEFLTQYWQALEDARTPDNYHRVHDVLHMWSLTSLALSDPGYEGALQEVLDGTAATIPIEQAVPGFDQLVTQARARRER
ncbi:hypothetical protein HNP84_007364 [Thermocatellispora tengchongensis]|uniref:Uncharacterized protein n=1 Tax=Thermocatellispora tengchongensis TaxID=1073253 RepID=A0A840PEK9_9ACTN|nr:DUF6247 family protein [Thermocatellispora tengchongensis]MBB5137612.1 hypothetical protein [Thermocatellispora tengchongensis]